MFVVHNNKHNEWEENKVRGVMNRTREYRIEAIGGRWYIQNIDPGAQMVQDYVPWAQTTIQNQPDYLWGKLYISKEEQMSGK